MDYLAHPQFFLNMLTEYLEEGNAVVVNQSNSLLQICFCGQTGQNLIFNLLVVFCKSPFNNRVWPNSGDISE